MFCRMTTALVMTGSTLTAAVIGASTAVRHGEGPTIGSFQGTVGVVAGGASVMDQLIGVVDGDTGRSTNNASMTA